MDKKIIILGAGPTGLGAAYRLKELGYKNFQVLEKENFVGGLSASHKDKKGFIWDTGGHVIHSHFPYFDNIVRKNLKNQKYHHQRESFVFSHQKLIPYPFQNHIHLLPLPVFFECFWNLAKRPGISHPAQFLNYIKSTFGSGISKYFMIPYNEKIWNYPLSKIGTSWLAQRISPITPTMIIKNAILGLNNRNWGPNNNFIYPKYGIGLLWKNLAKQIGDEYIKLDSEIVKIDPEKKQLRTSSKTYKYDILLSTIPLDILAAHLVTKPKLLQKQVSKLIKNSVCFVGIGLKKKITHHISWIYFPQKEIPFYRVTFLSSYSPYMTPKSESSSILTETTIKDSHQIDSQTIINGLVSTNIIDQYDISNIVDIWVRNVDYAYPIPTIDRDKTLKKIQPILESCSIYSRGRFGGWKYEIGNMDHSFMQGVEIVDRIFFNKKETVWSL